MPTYDYVCAACAHQFEAFQEMSAKKLRKCPKCGKNALERQVGAGAGLIFKGTGFYITDYKRGGSPPESGSGGAKKSADADAAPAAKPASEGSGGANAAPEAKATPATTPKTAAPTKSAGAKRGAKGSG